MLMNTTQRGMQNDAAGEFFLMSAAIKTGKVLFSEVKNYGAKVGS